MLGSAVLALVAVIALFGDADSHVKLSNLVSVLTGRWHLYGSGPVEIEVAECVGQLLQLDLLESGLVEWHMEVCRQHTPLVSPRRHHEEVEG